MNDLKYLILGELHASPHRRRNIIELLNEIPADPTSASYAIEDMEKEGLVAYHDPYKEWIKLTPKGSAAYESEHQSRNERSKQERANRKQRNFDNAIKIIGAVVAILGLAATAVSLVTTFL